MFNVKWDAETNGVILTSEEGAVNSPVRPVFFEELDLLRFGDQGFTYPRVKEPILWAAGRAYYYRGEKIANAKGGGFYEEVTLEVFSDPQHLDPVDVEAVLKKNEAKINLYSHDSIDFIRSTVEKYKDKVDIVTVSFSGGKDSIVVADLVKRSLESNNFIVVFSDTTLESPMTYDFVEQYIHDNPKLKILCAKYPISQHEMWGKFGPPSRMNRWCHTVYKTASIRKLIKEYLNLDSPRVLLIDGIRSEESARRSKYDNINFGTKDMLQVNISPILHWSSLEVFLYIFYRRLNINKMYRIGYTRVGCIICPYSSKWGEFLSYKLFNDEISPYLEILRNNATYAGITDINKYIADGGWKSRSGGADLEFGGNRTECIIKNDNIEISLQKNTQDFWQWIQTLGPVVKKREKCQIEYTGEIYPISQKISKNKILYTVENANDNIKLIQLLKRIAYKTEYCIRCQACEAVCPTGALIIDESIKLDSEKCTNCGNCINYVEKGCWVAKSITYVGYQMVKKMDTGKKGINRYQGFGLDKDWINKHLSGNDWKNDGSLGNCKVQSFKSWLMDAGLYDNDNSELCELFIQHSDVNDLFMWSVIWNNLAENAPLISWYTLYVPRGAYSKNDLKNLLAKYREEEISNRTDTNAIASLTRTFTESPIGEALGQGVEIKKGREKIYNKVGAEDIPDMAVLYSVYRYAERNNRRRLVASEFIKNKEVSPHTAFCMDYAAIKNALTRVAAKYPDLLYLEFSGNLDNIILSDSCSSLDVVKRYLENK